VGAVRGSTLPKVDALAESVERSAQRVGALAAEIEHQPDSLLWGRKAARPGPGEAGFQ
jgi:phospholipid/cholesterol/gamma-HCH transport system substrate-binding protein